MTLLSPPDVTARPRPTPNKTARVLVVEDDSDLRSALELQLRSATLKVSAAGDGHQALDLVRSFEPDIVVLDLGLPGIDGLDLLERLSGSATKSPAVIVLSAWDEQRCLPLALERGADLYFEKPVEFRELLDGIRYLIDTGR